MSTATSTKRFAPIRDDYAFFERHSTEAAADLRGYLPWLRSLPTSRPLRLLDFGCGPGGFSSRFLTAAAFPRERLSLCLVEPDDDYRAEAAHQLGEFTSAPVLAWPRLPPDQENCFDLVLANHVLYYVSDLDETLTLLLRALTRGGLLLAALAGQANLLMRLLEAGFGLIQQPVPYQNAEDLEYSLRRRGQPFRQQSMRYELTFPDSEANRLHVLRFLFGEHFDELPPRKLLELFDPHVREGQIAIHTGHEQFIVRRE